MIVCLPEDEDRVVALVDRVLPGPGRDDARPEPYRKANGYRATHRLVHPPNDASELSTQSAICEVQITTLASHLFNELEHDVTYKTHGVEPSANDHDCLRRARSLAELIDAEVGKLFASRRAAAQNAETIVDAESLRFVLEHEAGRPLTGDFSRLFAMLNGALENLSRATLATVLPFEPTITAGRSRASDLEVETPDDVMLLVLGAQDFHSEFVAQAQSWRGPKTPLRRALERLRLALSDGSGHNGERSR